MGIGALLSYIMSYIISFCFSMFIALAYFLYEHFISWPLQGCIASYHLPKGVLWIPWGYPNPLLLGSTGLSLWHIRFPVILAPIQVMVDWSLMFKMISCCGLHRYRPITIHYRCYSFQSLALLNCTFVFCKCPLLLDNISPTLYHSWQYILWWWKYC